MNFIICSKFTSNRTKYGMLWGSVRLVYLLRMLFDSNIT